MALPRPCLVCGTPSHLSRCPVHQAQMDALVEQRRGTPAARGYDAKHQRDAAALRKLRLPCSLCGQPIDYDLRAPHPMAFVAHHLTRDKRGPLAPAHKIHNEQAGQPAE